MAQQAALTPAQAQQKAVQANLLARQAVLARSVDMLQPVQSYTFNPAQINPLVISLRNVGLLKRILLPFTATIQNTDGALDLTLTDFGLSNVFSQIIYTDLSNNQRVQTAGWHLSLVNSIKHRKPYASAYALISDDMANYGENYKIITSPATIAHGTTATVRGVIEIPVAYNDDDLRGAVFANTYNATQNVTLQVNPAPFTAAGADSTFAVYKGTTSAVITSITVTNYQHYLDQLPQGPQGAVLPLLDISTVYELKNTSLGPVTANQDFAFQYPNFRDIHSTFLIYNKDTSTDTGRGTAPSSATDINYLALQSANFTNIWKRFPLDLAQPTRDILSTDPPVGCYYSSSRRKPISSNQYGNIEIVLNALNAGANSKLYVGLEMMNYPNMVVNAGSLQS